MPKCTQKCQHNFFSGSGWPTITEKTDYEDVIGLQLNVALIKID